MFCAILLAVISQYVFSSNANAKASTAYPSKSAAAQSVLKTSDIAYLAEISLALNCLRDTCPNRWTYWQSDRGWTLDYHPLRRSAIKSIAQKMYYGSQPYGTEFYYTSSSDWVTKNCSINASYEGENYSWPSMLRNYLSGYARPTWTSGSPTRCNEINSEYKFPNKADIKTLFDTANETTKNNKLLFYGYPNNLAMYCQNGRILKTCKYVNYTKAVHTSSSGQKTYSGSEDIETESSSTICTTNRAMSSGSEIARVTTWFSFDDGFSSKSSGHMVGETVDTYQDWDSNLNKTHFYRMEGEQPITISLVRTNLTSATVSEPTITAYALIKYGTYESGLSWISGTRSLAAWNCTDYNVDLGSSRKGSGTVYRYKAVPITLTKSTSAPAGRVDEGYVTYVVSGLEGIDSYNSILDTLGFSTFRLPYLRTSYLSKNEWLELGVPYFAEDRIPPRTTISTGDWCVELEQYATYDIEIYISIYAIFGFIEYTPKYQY